MLMEAHEAGLASEEAFRLAIVSADPAKWIPVMYPESVVKRDDQITSEDVEQSQGEWKFTDTEITPEMAEAMFAGMVADTDPHTLTMDDLARFGAENDDW